MFVVPRAQWCWSKLGMCFCLLLHSRYNVLYYLCDCPRWNWLDSIGFGKQSSSCIANRLAVTLLNIALRDIAFVISKKLSPSWRLSFRLVTNQLSLNTQSSKFLLLTTTIIVIEAQTDGRQQSLQIRSHTRDCWSRLCDQHAHNSQDLDSQVIIILWCSILIWLTTCPTLIVVCLFDPTMMT